MASFEIYIKNYKAQNGNIVSVERLMQTIPMTSDPVITNPKVKTDLGKAGSFEFGLEMNSPYYDAMLQMKTILRVVYFGVTIFRGRVLTIDKSFQRSRTVHCEGDLAFLIDSHQIGQKEESRPETDLFTYLTSVIAQHNSDVVDAEKRFTLGEVPMNYSQSVLSDQMVNIPSDKAIQKYGNSSYDTSMDRLESLLSDFGGYMRTRYDSSNGTTYLDWYDNYYNPYVGQDIEILSNLIDLSGPTEVENLFTVVLPIGKKDNGEVYINEWWPKVRLDHAKVNYITVPELATVPLYSDAELTSGYHRKEDYVNAISRFGRIWKVVEFENANTPQKLFTYAKDWIKNNFMPELTQWDVSALDMRFIDGQTRALYTGDRIKLVHPEVDQNYMYITIISAEYDLYNPDKNKFKIGVPNQQLNASYGVKQKSKGAKSFNSGITDLSSLTNDLEQQINSALEAIKRDRDILQQQYILKTTYGHDIGLDDPLAFLVYDTDCVTEKDPKEVAKEAGKVIQKLEWTKKLKLTELVQSAMQKSLDTGLPVAWDDLQNVIDNTPDIKRQQAAFKTLATDHLINDLNLPTDEAMDLLNDSSALYEAASMVDDNGNWTQKAIDKGALVWNPELKKIYVHAHDVVNNKSTVIGSNILEQAVGWMSGGSLDVGDGLSVESIVDELTGNVGSQIKAFGEKIIGYVTDNVDLSNFSINIQNMFNLDEIKNKATGWINKSISAINGLLNGNSKEKEGSTDKDDSINLMNGWLTGTDKKTESTGNKNGFFNFLGGIITGSNSENENTGEKSSFFDMIGGLFTGGETKESSAAEALKTFFLGNGVAEIDGENGTAQFGDGYEWMVKINDTVDNKDGFVSAKDFQTFQDIPSFKTQFAAIKTLFANHAELISTNIQKLTAVEGYINAISSSTIDAEKYVSAGYGSFNNLTVHSSLTADSYTANSFKLKVSDGEGGYENAELGDCFQSAGTKFENGVWTLVLYKIGGGSQEVPFDLTATDWYTNLVAGKTNEGWDNASAVVDIPKTESTDSRIIFVSTPYSRTYGNNTTRGTETNTYTLRNWNNNQVCLSWDQGHDGDGTIVSVFEHNQYNNGQNAMTANGSWDPHSPQDTTEEKATNTFRYQAYTTDNPPVAKGTRQATTVTLSSGMWIGNKKTVYLKEGNTQLAEFEVDASSLIPSGGGDGTITGIALNPSSKVTYDSTSEMLTVNMQASGTNITNSPFSDSDTLPVSATEVTLTKSDLSNTSTDTHGNTYAGRYYIRKNAGGVFKINQIDTISASVAQHRLNLELSEPSLSSFTWNDGTADSAKQYKYSYTATSELKTSSGTDALTSILSYETEEQLLNPTQAFSHGFNICFNSVSLEASKLELDPGDSVDVIPKMKGTWDASQAQGFSSKKITISAKAATVINVDKGSWGTGSNAGKIEFSPSSGTGSKKNVNLAFTIPTNTSTGNIQIGVVDSASPGSSSQPLSTNLSKTLVLTCDDNNATVKDGGTTVAQVPNNKSATTAGPITAIELRTVTISGQAKQYFYNESTNEYTVYVRAKGTNLANYDSQIFVSGTEARNSVTVTGIERIASCSFDSTNETARQNVMVTLSNGKTGTFEGIFDDVYQAGLYGREQITEAEFMATLESGGIIIDTPDELSVNVSDIYQQGVHDATPTVLNTYTYDRNGELIQTYLRAVILGSVKYIPVDTRFYPNTPVVRESSPTTEAEGYSRFTFNGSTYTVPTANLIDSATSRPSPSNWGNKTGIYVEEAPMELVSVSINWLRHKSYVGNVEVYMEPYGSSGETITSTYAGNYNSLSTDTVSDISAFLAELKTSRYGRYANAANLPDTLEHKVNFTAHYSNGTTESDVTYTVVITSYEAAGQQVDYGYMYVYASNNEGRCRFYITIGQTSTAHWVSCNSYVHLEEDPSNPTDETYVKVKYNNTVGYISKGLLHSTKKSDTGDGYPRVRTSGWADDTYIVGVFSAGFSKSARVGVQLVAGGQYYVTDLYGSRADVISNLGTQYLCSYGPPKNVFSSSAQAIGRTCRIVLSDTSIQSGSYTIKDENA